MAPLGCAGYSVKAAPSAKSDLMVRRLPLSHTLHFDAPTLGTACRCCGRGVATLTQRTAPAPYCRRAPPRRVPPVARRRSAEPGEECTCRHLMYTLPALHLQPRSIPSLWVRSWIRAGTENVKYWCGSIESLLLGVRIKLKEREILL